MVCESRYQSLFDHGKVRASKVFRTASREVEVKESAQIYALTPIPTLDPILPLMGSIHKFPVSNLRFSDLN